MAEGQKADLLHCHKLYASGIDSQSRVRGTLSVGPRIVGASLRAEFSRASFVEGRCPLECRSRCNSRSAGSDPTGGDPGAWRGYADPGRSLEATAAPL